MKTLEIFSFCNLVFSVRHSIGSGGEAPFPLVITREQETPEDLD